jgi:hypothetical protein
VRDICHVHGTLGGKQKGAHVEISTNPEIAALLMARRVLNAKLWDINHTNHPKSEKKLLKATTPLLAELHANTVALRAAIVGRVWCEHPDWRRARVADQHQVINLAESLYAELVSSVEYAPVGGKDRKDQG